MATLAELSPTPPQSPTLRMRRKSWARKCERYCCSIVSYFPLCIVYGLTTWAVWVATKIGMQEKQSTSIDYFFAVLAVALYAMLNWSYTTAVFTDPGSPIDSTKGGYNSLPTQELSRPYTSFTVKANGELRYCKKCQSKKPDRAHHCSTCKRCVLKMDHHCPWLAACIGLRNYKPFLLFLIYLSLFCWACFALSGVWCWKEFTNDQYMDSLMPVNYIVLAVISGIVGLVITGFTVWHIMLAARGLTTIESLEKTRYLSPLRKSMQRHFNNEGQRHYLDGADGRPSISEQIMEIHANAIPGVTRPEEGEEYRSASPAQRSLQRNWADIEAQRERERYDEYLDEIDSEKLPNAFDLGWRRNLVHVMGENPWFWALPICNTTGDGWRWEASDQWVQARERIAEERFTQMQRQKDRERAAGWGIDSPPSSSPPRYTYNYYSSRNSNSSIRPLVDPAPPPRRSESRFLTTTNGVATVPREGRRSPGKADAILGRAPGMYSDDPGMPMGGGVPMQYMGHRNRGRTGRSDVVYDDFEDDDEEYDESSDEGEDAAKDRKAANAASATTTAASGSAATAAPGATATTTANGTAAAPDSKTDNWNDLPADMLAGGQHSRSTSKTKRGPTARKKKAEEEWQEWGPK